MLFYKLEIFLRKVCGEIQNGEKLQDKWETNPLTTTRSLHLAKDETHLISQKIVVKDNLPKTNTQVFWFEPMGFSQHFT